MATSFRPHAVVAIDFGTAASGYAIVLDEGKGPGNARVLPYRPGDRSNQATEKNLTAILLEADTLRPLEIGREARKRFFDADVDEQRGYLFLSQFKMAMSPDDRSNSVPLMQRTVLGEGANVAVPLITAVAKLLAYIRDEALERAAACGANADRIGWVLTVPAIWDEAGKSFMRRAAVEAGIIGDVDSERLALALEPEGAVIASAMDAPPELRKKLSVGKRVMVLDCGGGTVDVTVSELVGSDPPRLKEILPPSGGPWGGTGVDAAVRVFFNELLYPSGSDEPSPADIAATAQAMDAFETAKCGWDPALPGKDKVTINGLASVCEHVGGADVMAARVVEYNARHGLEGAAAVVYRPRAFALVLPLGLVKSFMDACVEPICAHMQELLVAAAAKRRAVDFVMLVGGFAESTYLQRMVREALQTDDGPAAQLVVPAKPVQSVVRGAALYGLYPSSFIASRIAKATIAVSLCEPYNPRVHEPLPHAAYRSGRFVQGVLVPLVQKGDSLDNDHKVEHELLPLKDGQASMSFAIYSLDRRLPPLDATSPRTYEVFNSVAPHVDAAFMASDRAVLESSKAAELCVRVQTAPGGAGGYASAAGTAGQLTLYFGRTEITAHAVGKGTGDSRKVTIAWSAGEGLRAASGAPSLTPVAAAAPAAEADDPGTQFAASGIAAATAGAVVHSVPPPPPPPSSAPLLQA